MRADNITIETDEDGFHMVVETSYTDAPWHTFHMRISDPKAFHQEVAAKIGPWLDEMKAVENEFGRRPWEVPADDTGYAITDPKHPRHHEVMADIADLD